MGKKLTVILIVCLIAVIAAVAVSSTGAIFQSSIDVSSGGFTADVSAASSTVTSSESTSSQPASSDYGSLQFRYGTLESDLNIILAAFNDYLAAYPQEELPSFSTWYTPNYLDHNDDNKTNNRRRAFAEGFYAYLDDPLLTGRDGHILDFRIFVSTRRVSGTTVYKATMIFVRYQCLNTEPYYRYLMLQGCLLADETFFNGFHYNSIPRDWRESGVCPY